MIEKMITSFDGTQLYMKKEVAEGAKAIVVIVHGLCEHQGRYDYFAEKLHAAGYGTYRFDHRGHGRSQGDVPNYGTYHEILDDTNVIVDMAIAENPDVPVYLLGHSMGGFAVSLYGAKYQDKKLRGIVTSGAAVCDTIGLFAGAPAGMDPNIQLPNALGSGVCSVAEVVDWYGKDPYNKKAYCLGLVYALKDGQKWFSESMKTFAYPVFMTHGEKDGLVGMDDSVIFFRNAASTDKTLKIYGNVFHEILNEYIKDEVIADMVSWMDKRI